MAFTATVRSSTNLGGSGGARLILGDWTGSAGDAAGTLSFAGAIPAICIFQKFDPIDNSYQIIPRVECSYSAGITTVTIENQDNVTTGRFMIIDYGN